MNLQVFRGATALLETGHCFRLIYGVLGHLSIGRPLAAGDGQQSGVGDQNRMIAGQGGGAFSVANLHQRTQTGKHA